MRLLNQVGQVYMYRGILLKRNNGFIVVYVYYLVVLYFYIYLMILYIYSEDQLTYQNLTGKIIYIEYCFNLKWWIRFELIFFFFYRFF